MSRRLLLTPTLIVAVALLVGGCSRRTKPVTTAQPAPTTSEASTVPTPPPAPRGGQPVVDSQPTIAPAIVEDSLAERTLEDLNRDSPLKPAYFGLDSAELDDEGRTIVAANAEVLRRNSGWTVTVEGHCDERGTAEYNLALGERRAQAARSYLLSLGIPASRLRTVSYGDEYPFDRGHTNDAWSRNRRAHFVITAK
jgi:peptidoglycan-associated lipoprotein